MILSTVGLFHHKLETEPCNPKRYDYVPLHKPVGLGRRLRMEYMGKNNIMVWSDQNSLMFMVVMEESVSVYLW
jgi:hypothetical protein